MWANFYIFGTSSLILQSRFQHVISIYDPMIYYTTHPIADSTTKKKDKAMSVNSVAKHKN